MLAADASGHLAARVFDKAALDAACEKLAVLAADGGGAGGGGLWSRVWNPHRSSIGLGNYDVNALTLALEQRGADLQSDGRNGDLLLRCVLWAEATSCGGSTDAGA